MDRCDAESEGITLPPANLNRMIARDEANHAIIQHISLCPLNSEHIAERLRLLENRFSLLIGLMVGSGLLGGLAGGALIKLFPH